MAERWVVPTWVVLSIIVTVVVVALATAAELWLVLGLGLLVLGLSLLVSRLFLVLGLLLWSSMGWGSWGYWQMVTRSLESILASNVGDGSSLPAGVNVAVGSATVTVGVGLLLEVSSILLIVSGTELSVTGKVTLLTQDRGCLRITVVSTVVLCGRGHQQR